MEHLHLFGVDIGTWQDIEAIFSMVVTVIGLVGVYFAWQQITSNVSISNREKSLEAFLEFSNKYDELSRLDHANVQRFRRGDTSLSEAEMAFYYDAYWVLHLQEWQFFQARILPVSIYAMWIQHLHEYLHRDRSRRYFDGNGQMAEMSFVEGFETYGIHVLRFHADFVAFIRDLQQVPFQPDERGAARCRASITRLLHKHRHTGDYWKLG